MSRGFQALLFIALGAFFIIGVLAVSRTSRQSTVPTSNQPSGQSNRDTGASPCTAADFSLSKLKANAEYEVAKLTGIVTSHCASAAGVQLKWTAFNSDGTVAFSEDFWPASTTNIPPRTDYAFEMMNSAPRGKWTYRVEPIGVNVW